MRTSIQFSSILPDFTDFGKPLRWILADGFARFLKFLRALI
ncbi:hypothetical protein STRDD11_01081 [Streptococcus sp. DD11]|nr:hypothetical protein STRDD11_01081 [Streptococcus sp. DD11]